MDFSCILRFYAQQKPLDFFFFANSHIDFAKENMELSKQENQGESITKSE